MGGCATRSRTGPLSRRHRKVRNVRAEGIVGAVCGVRGWAWVEIAPSGRGRSLSTSAATTARRPKRPAAGTCQTAREVIGWRCLPLKSNEVRNQRTPLSIPKHGRGRLVAQQLVVSNDSIAIPPNRCSHGRRAGHGRGGSAAAAGAPSMQPHGWQVVGGSSLQKCRVRPQRPGKGRELRSPAPPLAKRSPRLWGGSGVCRIRLGCL